MGKALKRVLQLIVKGEYFHAIKNGEKKEEYRLASDYWRKRIIGRDYDEVHIRWGYPKRDDLSKLVIKKYGGARVKMLKHKHFGDKEVEVIAIKLD